MLFKVIALLMYIAISCNSEIKADDAAPYPPSGWRPEKPFNSPRRYLPEEQTNATNQMNIPKQSSDGYQPTRRPNFVNIQRPNDQYRESGLQQRIYPLLVIPNINDGKDNKKLLNENIFLERYTKGKLQFGAREQNQQTQQLNDRRMLIPVANTQFDITKGQYYILNPDNSIQQVAYTTHQNQQQMKNKEFTAILKYTKVGDVNDPIYKYNSEGQLERIVRK